MVEEWNQDSVRSQAKEDCKHRRLMHAGSLASIRPKEGALIARLPVQVQMDGQVGCCGHMAIFMLEQASNGVIQLTADRLWTPSSAISELGDR